VIFGLVLAGGRASRFGADKALAELDGRSLIDAAAATLGASCARMAISARDGGTIAAYADRRGLERLDDPAGAPRGPLSGVLAGLVWARLGGARLLATAPCDTPFLPGDMVERLAAALGADDGAAVARAPDGLHPLCGVWRVERIAELEAALAEGAHPRVRDVIARLHGRAVDFEDAAAFFNINTREDLALAARRSGGAATAER
jgi:molybdopterin-guanine dinucleotide biosynthesis protein A